MLSKLKQTEITITAHASTLELLLMFIHAFPFAKHLNLSKYVGFLFFFNKRCNKMIKLICDNNQ